jgi:nucleoporin NUP82
MKELSRQLTKLEELKRRSGDLRESTLGATSSTGNSAGGLVSRMNKVEENQVALLERLDRVLQRLMESHQGQDKLSQYEKKWFDELGRMEKQVKGGLEPKAKRVEAMWEELRPGVEEMAARKKQQQQEVETPSRGGGLGRTQIKGLESKLSEEWVSFLPSLMIMVVC